MVKESDIGKQVYFISPYGIRKGELGEMMNWYLNHHMDDYKITTKNNEIYAIDPENIFTSQRKIIHKIVDAIPTQKPKISEYMKRYLILIGEEKIYNTPPIYILDQFDNVHYGVILSVMYREKYIYHFNDNGKTIQIPCYSFFDMKLFRENFIDIEDTKVFSTKDEVIQELTRKIKEL